MKIGIIGGGFQGVCVALALAKTKQHDIEILESGSKLITGASNVGEAKIHLGLVYAKDQSLQTATRLIQDALAFGPLLEDFAGVPIPWSKLKSNPFIYLISKDSMLAIEDHLHYYHTVDDLFGRHLENGSHYLGERPEHIFDPTPNLTESYRDISVAVRSKEYALKMDLLIHILNKSLKDINNIKIIDNCAVKEIITLPQGYHLEGYCHDETWKSDYDVIINCSWHNRLVLDAQVGLQPEYSWSHRLKYRLLIKGAPANVTHRSYTIVQGPFGDLVSYPDYPYLYASWYPSCMQEMVSSLAIPADWQLALGPRKTSKTEDIARDTLRSMDPIFPGIINSEVIDVACGVIYARGRTDIADPNSALHMRSDEPIQKKGGYFSINTGKLTSAPRNAHLLVKML